MKSHDCFHAYGNRTLFCVCVCLLAPFCEQLPLFSCLHVQTKRSSLLCECNILVNRFFFQKQPLFQVWMLKRRDWIFAVWVYFMNPFWWRLPLFLSLHAQMKRLKPVVWVNFFSSPCSELTWCDALSHANDNVLIVIAYRVKPLTIPISLSLSFQLHAGYNIQCSMSVLC